MAVEHSISTLVTLSCSDPGAPGGSWRYWSDDVDGPDSVASFGALRVTLTGRERMPSYVKREFNVFNTKAEEEVTLTHFEYGSWPGDPGVEAPSAVPASTHGLLDLVEHATAHRTEAGLTGPIAVHCRRGSDRSSVYVALSCLVLQIKNEGRCDVFTAVRKLRSQRQGMVQHLVSLRAK